MIDDFLNILFLMIYNQIKIERAPSIMTQNNKKGDSYQSLPIPVQDCILTVRNEKQR